MPAPKGHLAYNKNGEGGRPKIYTTEVIEKEAEALEEWMKDKNNLFLEEFAFERGYDTDKLHVWAKENERFRGTYKRLQERQKIILYRGGLSKKFAYPMCALILANSHGIVAKTEQKLSGSAVEPLAFALDKIDGKTKDLVNE